MKSRKLLSLCLSLLMVFTSLSTVYGLEIDKDCTWENAGNDWQLKYSDGSFATDKFETVGKFMYHFDKDGLMDTGLKEIDGKTYLFHLTGGNAMTGWQWYDNAWMAFDNNNCTMETGWVSAGKYSYYLNENGHMLTGWQDLNGERYFFHENKKIPKKSGGNAVTGWQKIDGASFYFNKDGSMASDEFTPDGYYVDSKGKWDPSVKKLTLADIPKYNGNPFATINGNKPFFSKDEKKVGQFEALKEFDKLGRAGEAYAEINRNSLPTEDRGSIGMIKPSGWHTVKYDCVPGKYLYNRCHLIGYQLTGNNDEHNLITGTRYFNVEGMLPFENLVADYVKETGNHVLYRVTPMFEGNDLVAKGVLMEAYSVEDNGEGVSFNVFVYNVQPGVTIDYATGNSALNGEPLPDADIKPNPDRPNIGPNYPGSETGVIRGNIESKIYHCPGQMYYDRMLNSKNLILFDTEEEAIKAGYRKAKR